MKAPLLAILDRDGVLNVDKGYVWDIEDFVWQPDAKTAVGWLNGQGYTVVVATNQSGIGRGYYTFAEFEELTDWMLWDLRKSGAYISRVYYCPHVPGDKCLCRKPEVGMIRAAVDDWGGYRHTFLVGDKESDIAAAERFGIPGHRFYGGSLLEFVKSIVMGGGSLCPAR